MAFWRISLPFLKYAVPLPILARMMWARRFGSADAATKQDVRKRTAALKQVLVSGGRLFASRNCLERSLVLYRVLSHAGASPTLVVGVHREREHVKGHAWVELDGEPVHDWKCRAFRPIVVFGANGTPSPVP